MLSYPEPGGNEYCRCAANPVAAFWCQTGHMLECHYPYGCVEAGCSHLARYDYSVKEAEALVVAAMERLWAGLMPEYKLVEGMVVVVPWRDAFGRYAELVYQASGLEGLREAFSEAGFDWGQVGNTLVGVHRDDPEAVITMTVKENGHEA